MLKTIATTAAAFGVLALAGCQRRAEGPAAPAAGTVEATCLEAVATETDNPDVALLAADRIEGPGAEVYVGVGPDRAPWLCAVSPEGGVTRIMFAGSEGAL